VESLPLWILHGVPCCCWPSCCTDIRHVHVSGAAVDPTVASVLVVVGSPSDAGVSIVHGVPVVAGVPAVDYFLAAMGFRAVSGIPAVA
jgi:hypothetical protein